MLAASLHVRTACHNSQPCLLPLSTGFGGVDNGYMSMDHVRIRE